MRIKPAEQTANPALCTAIAIVGHRQRASVCGTEKSEDCMPCDDSHRLGEPLPSILPYAVFPHLPCVQQRTSRTTAALMGQAVQLTPMGLLETSFYGRKQDRRRHPTIQNASICLPLLADFKQPQTFQQWCDWVSNHST